MISVFLLSCAVRLPDPVVTGLVPDRGWNGEETTIVIEGEGFYPQVEISTNRSGNVDLDRGYQAFLQDDVLGRHALAAVTIESYGQLRGTVRSGIAAGEYDLIVEGPTGAIGVLQDAYTVSNNRADRLTLEVMDLVATVNDQVSIGLQVVDPAGEPVLIDLQVVLRAVGASGPVDGQFGGGLEDAVTLDGVAVQGSLGADGAAVVALTVRTPDTIEISAEVVDASSGVRADQVNQLWQAGNQLSTVFSIPVGLEVQAGVPFDVGVRLEDQFGNPVSNVSENVIVQSACDDFIAPWLLTGSDTFEVDATRSTEFLNCPEQYLRILQGPPGVSRPFTVLAGDPASLQVSPSSLQVVAGDEVFALISARDEYDNRTEIPGTLDLVDSVGGLNPASCSPAFNQIDKNCRAFTSLAHPMVTLAASAGPVEGRSSPYAVIASDEVAHITLQVPGQVVAGEPGVVELAFEDRFGNVIDPSRLDLTTLSVGANTGHGRCQAEPLLPFAVPVLCTLEVADPETQLEAVLGAIHGTSDPFDVVNGSLASVEIQAPAHVEAGAAFHLDIQAFDAFGNPWIEQTTTNVTVEEPTLGSLDLTFLPDGTASLPVALTVAGESVIQVVGPDPLGEVVVSVSAGPAVTALVEAAGAWTFIGAPLQVRVSAQDAFGNTAAETVHAAVHSVSGGGPAIQIELVEGVGSGTFLWESVALDDRLEATAAGFAGASQRIDAVQSCHLGPIAAVDFAGAGSGRACMDGAPAPVAVSLAGSTPGAHPLELYVAQVAGVPVHATSAAFNVEVTQLGANPIQVLVADVNGCAATAASTIWAGPDDGSAVGLLATEVTPQPAAIGAILDVEVVGALDCTGDPATGPLRVRTERGIVLGASTSGTGLMAALDASGSTSFQVDTTTVMVGGETAVHINAPSGGAGQAVQVALTGDDAPPVVWALQPSGAATGPLDTLVLDFNEPLLELTLDPSAFSLSPTGHIQAAHQITPGRVELELAAVLEAGDGVWTLSADDSLRDLGGNRLVEWMGVFGDVTSVLDEVECTLPTALFRPDGDPGLAEEADEISIQLTSATVPGWWQLRVEDDEGVRRDQRRQVPTGSTDSISWDGRDHTGRIVEDGVYTLRVAALDDLGNRTAPCVTSVTVDNDR